MRLGLPVGSRVGRTVGRVLGALDGRAIETKHRQTHTQQVSRLSWQCYSKDVPGPVL